MNTASHTTLHHLPVDLLDIILSFGCDSADLRSLMSVSKTFRGIFRETKLAEAMAEAMNALAEMVHVMRAELCATGSGYALQERLSKLNEMSHANRDKAADSFFGDVPRVFDGHGCMASGRRRIWLVNSSLLTLHCGQRHRHKSMLFVVDVENCNVFTTTCADCPAESFAMEKLSPTVVQQTYQIKYKSERSSIPFRAPRPNEPPMPTQAAAERFIRDFMSQGGERRISPEYLPLFRWLLLRNPRVFLTWDGITAFVGRTGAHPCLLFYSKQYDNTFTVSYSRCIAMDAEKAANEWCKAVNGNLFCSDFTPRHKFVLPYFYKNSRLP